MQNGNVKFKIILVIVFIAALVLTGRCFLSKSDKPSETYVAEIKDKIEQAESSFAKIAEEKKKIELNKINESDKNPSGNQSAVISEKILIKVPFASQAPFGNWDEKHEEACEEASILMVAYYLQGKELNKDIAEREIQKMIDFEVNTYGDYKDSNVEEIIKLAEDFYGLKNLKAVYDFGKEELKKELAEGNPVIIPAAGRELGNPYYTAPGPLYHNLVLIGYSGNQIITNDPGTRRGEGYRYNIDVLYDAIHNFPGNKDKIREGERAMIVIDSGN